MNTDENPPMKSRELTMIAFLNFSRSAASVSCSTESPVI